MAPSYLTEAGDTEVVLASLPILAAVAYATNKFMSAGDDWEKKGLILIASGVVTLGLSGLFMSVCDGDVRGACKHAPTW